MQQGQVLKDLSLHLLTAISLNEGNPMPEAVVVPPHMVALVPAQGSVLAEAGAMVPVVEVEVLQRQRNISPWKSRTR